MKVLNQTELNAVAGGAFDCIVAIHVPTAAESTMLAFINAIVTNQVTSVEDILQGLGQADPAIVNQITLDRITIADYN